jgi:hypothetical protein
MGSQLHAFYATLEKTLPPNREHSPEHPAPEIKHAADKNDSIFTFSKVVISDDGASLHDGHAVGKTLGKTDRLESGGCWSGQLTVCCSLLDNT